MNEQGAGQLIDTNRDALAEAIVEALYLAHPRLKARYGPLGRAKCLQDTLYHLQYLVEAVEAASPILFEEYVAWAKVLLSARSVSSEDLKLNLEVLRDVLRSRLPEAEWGRVSRCLEGALERLPRLPDALESFLVPDSPLFELATGYLEALLHGDRQSASRSILAAVEGGVGVKDIYLEVFEACQREIGRLWQMNRVSVAQEHFCTAATQLVMSQLYPYIFATQKSGRRLVAHSVGGELHELGVRMVADFLELEGWDTYYLGASTPPESVLLAIEERQAQAVAISATMIFHVSRVSKLIERIRSSPRTPPVRILVGGYPFNVDPDLWLRVGADGFARGAREAVVEAHRLFEDVA